MSDPKKTIRCSSLPILEKCFGQLGAEMTIGIETEIAETGTNVHAYAAQLIREARPPEIQNADPDFLFLASRVRLAWDNLGELFPSPVVEQFLEADLPKFSISGHPDLFGIEGDAATILDFKSGYKTDADVLAQLRGYCFLVGSAHKEIKVFRVIVCWLRDTEVQEWSFSRAEIREWAGSLHRRAASWNGSDFTAGEHCQYCPRFHDCPARHQLARSAVRDIMELDMDAASRGVLAERMPDLYAFVRMVGKQVEAFWSWLREDIQKNGPMVCRPDKTLELKTQNVQVLDVRKGWRIFAGTLSEDELADCMTVSKTKLLAAVGAKAGPRMGGKDKAAVMQALEEAGAISIKPRLVLTWTKGDGAEE